METEYIASNETAKKIMAIKHVIKQVTNQQINSVIKCDLAESSEITKYSPN